MIKVYTSKEVLELFHDEMDLYELEFLDGYCDYILTEGELGWLNFIKDKYCIADYLFSLFTSEDYIRINFREASIAMNADCQGMGKAVMLSDDTALQALLFMNYIEDTSEWDEWD